MESKETNQNRCSEQTGGCQRGGAWGGQANEMKGLGGGNFHSEVRSHSY